jgi:hypothetical protein
VDECILSADDDPRFMRPTAKQAVQRVLHRLGLDVRWHVPRPVHALSTLLDLYNVDTVFDIGAEHG